LYASPMYQRGATSAASPAAAPAGGHLESDRRGDLTRLTPSAAVRSRSHRPLHLSKNGTSSTPSSKRRVRQRSAVVEWCFSVEARRQPPPRAVDAAVPGPVETGLYLSTTAGQSWKKVARTNRGRSTSTSSRFSSAGASRSRLPGCREYVAHLDGGKTTEARRRASVHDDIHAIWIDPNNSIKLSSRRRRRETKLRPAPRHGISIQPRQSARRPVLLWRYDMAYPYNVCGGMTRTTITTGAARARVAAEQRDHEPTIGSRFRASLASSRS